FSNFGSWISFAAPGVDIVTTTVGGDYASSSGTSPAAAYGSGVFALLFAVNPTMPRATAIQRVEAGAIDLGSSGWDPYFGWGRADAYAALVPGQHGAPQLDMRDPTVSIVYPVKDSLLSGMVPVDIAASDDIGIARVELFVDKRWFASTTSPPYAFVLDASGFEPGAHKLRAYAYDTSNNLTKTKTLKVSFTPGAGLLVNRATAKLSSTSISAVFALPAGVNFDPTLDHVTITLTTARGTVWSALVAPGGLSLSGGGKMQANVPPNMPVAGNVRVTAKRSGASTVYTLKVKASKLSGMTALEPQMSLAVQVGGVQLSQSLPFRVKGAILLYP
ncbi:MAG: Ig-like domain-containing protein, partial [bacterium]